MRRAVSGIAMLVVAALGFGTWYDSELWRSAEQRGDRLMAQQQYRQAAAVYTDPWRIGSAQYRDGDFEAAARTFARVPGAVGAFNQGNAWLMHGQYETAVASYDRALAFRPDWQAAQDNRALAVLRQKLLADAGENQEQDPTVALSPDDEVVDQKGDQQDIERRQLNDAQLSDEELRATWLRRVQTTPGDFLRAKFAYQAAHAQDTQADVGAHAEDAP